MRLWRHGVELDPGPRQQAYLLALLAAQAGRPISTDALIDLIWEDQPPATAVNLLHKHIGALRRLLEPTLPARATGSYVHRRSSGYFFVSDPYLVDAVAFRRGIDAANAALAEQRGKAALDAYLEALSQWQGPVAAGLDRGPTATAILGALDNELFDACIAATELAIGLGRPEQVFTPLRLAASMAPFNESVQAGLVNALAAAGHRAEALAVYQRVRARLVDELGLDPGPALESARRRVLLPADPQRNPTDGFAALTPPRPAQPHRSDALVGRAKELATLRTALESTLTGGTALLVIEGEPGGGKTRLMQEAVGLAEERGAVVTWGHCLQGDATPPLWPWVEAIRVILDGLGDGPAEALPTGGLGRLLSVGDDAPDSLELPDSAARFDLFEQVVSLIVKVSGRRPIVLVIDDLQWADTVSLQLLRHLASRLPNGTAIVGALRTRAPVPGSELTRTLASVSRVPGQRRLRLGPLGAEAVAELIRHETTQTPAVDAVRTIHARTGGNPFFVRELSRFLADAGAITDSAAAHAGVPATVRDVVRDRMAGLDDQARLLLQIAALVGREVELGLLLQAADLDAQTCLVRLESLDTLGLLCSTPGDPFLYRFPHDLVRESVADTASSLSAPRLHLRIADALERGDAEGETTVERLAAHLWSAGPLADPTRTAGALVRAGRRAASRFAFETGERQLRSAVQVARAANLAEVELPALSELIAVLGMQQMWSAENISALERAEHLARILGLAGDAASFMLSQWTAYTDGLDVSGAGRVAERMLRNAEASSDPTVRIFGWYAWGIQQWSTGRLGQGARYLSRLEGTAFTDFDAREADPTAHHLQMLMAAEVSESAALNGEVAKARDLLDRLEAAAGDDPYGITIWASTAARTGAQVGAPDWALRAGERGIAVDPDFSFVYLGTSLRISRCWAMAVTGQDPTWAAAEAQRVLDVNFLHPPRSMAGLMCVLVGATHLAAGALGDAAAALDLADRLHTTYGQCYAESQLLLTRTRLLQAQGEPDSVVRTAAQRARAYARDHEAYLFERLADEFLQTL